MVVVSFSVGLVSELLSFIVYLKENQSGPTGSV